MWVIVNKYPWVLQCYGYNVMILRSVSKGQSTGPGCGSLPGPCGVARRHVPWVFLRPYYPAVSQWTTWPDDEQCFSSKSRGREKKSFTLLFKCFASVIFDQFNAEQNGFFFFHWELFGLLDHFGLLLLQSHESDCLSRHHASKRRINVSAGGRGSYFG